MKHKDKLCLPTPKEMQIVKYARALACMLILLVLSSVCQTAVAQQKQIPAMNLNNVSISQVLTKIEKETDYVFLITDESKSYLLEKTNVNTPAQSASSLLNTLLKDTNLSYTITGNQIAIFRKAAPATQSQQVTVCGVVSDENGSPMVGVAVYLKSNPQRGVTTNLNGEYELRVPASGSVLVCNFIGRQPQEVAVVPGTTRYNVTLGESKTKIDRVIVETGMFQRDKVSFTGSTASFSGEDLKTVGNQNILQSLKTLDPSFVMIDNVQAGANPNSMPTIEMRGQGSATINAITDEFSTDPNMPLFVLDGVEVKIDRINDLDINRVESIHILKDAGSTAIYGSKGANGVVVVETIKAQAGNYQVYYTGDFQVDIPDLSVYNMMNASEKLEFERLSGKYSAVKQRAGGLAGSILYQKSLDELYNYRLRDVLSGVDTYWLSEPVHTAFTHGHSARVTGGSNDLAVDVGLKYKNTDGVMKGADRETYGGNIGLTFRRGKIVISNSFNISGYEGNESYYGSFSTWANASPYFRKHNADGGIDKYLQKRDDLGYVDSSHSGTGMALSAITKDIVNPLYDASLPFEDKQRNLYFSNSFFVQYNINDYVRIKGGFDMSKDNTKYNKFTSPEHSQYDYVDAKLKGEYSYRNYTSSSYKGYINATYAQTFARVHSLTANIRGTIESSENELTGFKATGFKAGDQAKPNQGKYPEGGNPIYNEQLQREVALIASANYNYDLRYLLDATLSVDGASTFGSNKIYQTFWSVGAGWNINRERFARDWKWLDLLKIRASMGTSGNQNIGTVYSNSLFQDYLATNVFGQGAYLYQLGNPNLPWQVAKDYGAGLDLRMMNGRLSMTFDYFNTKTDPLVININQAPSTGIVTYPFNLGHMTKKGYEAVVSYSPIYNLEERIIWTIRATGAHSKSEFGGLGNRLDDLENQSTMQRYKDGQSPTALWAVQSYGIDPSTGKEIFIKKDGTFTYLYDPTDVSVVGDTRPDLMGVISTAFRYKNFSANIAFRYSIGGDKYNTTLYNKVENITLADLEKNQDKRALYNRWTTVGQQARFKGIGIVETASERTSRFVQKDNYLTCESISLSYELNNNPWLKKNLGVRNMRASIFAYDIFRLETSKVERGIESPFRRAIAMSLSLSF